MGVLLLHESLIIKLKVLEKRTFGLFILFIEGKEVFCGFPEWLMIETNR